MGLGWGIQQLARGFNIPVHNLESILPLFGTIGLILIVLEGSLELDLNRSKLCFVGKSAIMALVPMLLVSLTLAYAFCYFEQTSFISGWVNAIPLCVISSAIAIPSARNLYVRDKEFITYESSLSDIFGVLLFNFIATNNSFGFEVFSSLLLQLLLIVLISFAATLGLTFLLRRLHHHVKYTPIILLVVLIYAISKALHLPALLFIMLFGLFLGNLSKLSNYKIINNLRPSILEKEVHKFKELVVEMTFLIRSSFFLLFGFLLQTSEILNQQTILWAIAITVGIFVTRAIMLKLMKIPLLPLVYIAPRGLITILLFLSIPAGYAIDLAVKSLIVQVVIITALIMMFGLMKNKPKVSDNKDLNTKNESQTLTHNES
jgi:hypothetical protein